MSEYQYVYFGAIDKPLDDEQLEFMRRQSTRAEVTRWQFTNEYHWGDFHGDADEMLRRGYDVHYHFANFGIRKLMFRLPELPCPKKTFALFQVGNAITWHKDKHGKAGILSIDPEADAGTYDFLEDVGFMVPYLEPLREMLIVGDLRPLYLVWLATCFDDEAMEPPVPAGLNQLDAALDALAELYEIPDALIKAAAEESPALPEKKNEQNAMMKWVDTLSNTQLKQIVRELLTEDATTVQADVRKRYRKQTSSATLPLAKPSRTCGQLRETAAAIEKDKQEKEQAAAKRARAKHLKSIAKNPEKTLDRIDELAAARTRDEYQQIVECLNDLAEALSDDAGPAKARVIAQQLRQRRPHSRVLIGILRTAGWLD